MPLSLLTASLLGIAIGVISGLVGIGGGALLIPALVWGYGLSQIKAQGTSLAVLLLPTGIFAFWSYYKAGNVDLKLAVPIVIGFAAGGYLGGLWAQHLSPLFLRRSFAALLLVIALKLVFTR